MTYIGIVYFWDSFEETLTIWDIFDSRDTAVYALSKFHPDYKCGSDPDKFESEDSMDFYRIEESKVSTMNSIDAYLKEHPIMFDEDLKEVE